MSLNVFKLLESVFNGQKYDSAVEYSKQKINKSIECALLWIVMNYDDRMDEEWMVHTWVNITMTDMISKYWLSIQDFENKTTLDIWWGFSGLPFLLEWVSTNTIIVDPLFSYNIINQLEININLIDKYILKNLQNIDNFKLEISEIDNIINEFNLGSVSKLLTHISNEKAIYQQKINKYEQIVESQYAILEDLNKWLTLSDTDFQSLQSKKWLNLWSNTFNINSSFWDNIEWIDENSIDIIFINHVITKATVNPLNILLEADRVLKIWWKIFIMENTNFASPNVEDFWNYDLEIKYEWNKSIFILTKKELV